jgi:putative membrane protein
LKPILFALLVLTGCTPDADQHAHARPAGEARVPVLSPQDRDFLERAAEGSNAEIAIGALGRSRGVRPEVRAFGQRMVADHRAINAALAAIAARHRIVLPTSLGEHQARFDRVVDHHRERFDEEFLKVMVDDHHAAYELFRSEASGGVHPELKAFAARTLPTIAAHLEHAKAVAGK